MNNANELSVDEWDTPRDTVTANFRARMDGQGQSSTQRTADADFPNYAAPEEPKQSPLDLWTVLDPLLRRWPWIVGSGIALFVLGLIVSPLIWRPAFTSTAQLIAYDPPVSSDSFKPRPIATTTVLNIVGSAEFAQKIGAELATPATGQEISRRLKVTPERNSDITTVSATGRDAESAVELVNAFTQAAVQTTKDMQKREAAEANVYVSQQLSEVEHDLSALRQQVKTTIPPPVDPEIAADKQAQSVQALKISDKIQSAKDELAALRSKYTEAHPLVKEQRAKVASLMEQYSSELAAASRPAKVKSDPAVSPEQNGLQGREYEDILVGQLRTLENNRALLVSRQRAVSMFTNNPPGYFRLLMPATVQEAVRQHNGTMKAAFALFLGVVGLLGGVGFVLAREFVDRRLKTAGDVTRVTGLPVLASVGDITQFNPGDEENWAFRTWTALQSRLSLSPNHGMICGITSAASGEGRSTWIKLLSQAASHCGFRVLTVAAGQQPVDEKKSSETPAGQTAPVEVEHTGTELAMSILNSPAQVTEKLMGPNPNPIVHIPLPGWVWNLDRRKQWQVALNSWRTIDNIVILVDLPPASVPGAVLLAANLPNLLWLSETGKSDASQTKAQLETLRHARCNLVGAVINRESPTPVRGRFSRWFNILLPLAILAMAHGPSVVAQDAEGVGSFSASKTQRAEWQQKLTLGPGDVLSLSLFGQPELTRADISVGPDGRISYLEAENVVAAGLTVDELRSRINEELGKFRNSPEVIVVPSAYRSKKYFVLGRVTQRGVFTLDRPITIIEAVARARGLETNQYDRNLTEVADFSHAFLSRGGRQMPINFEKLFLQGDLSQNIALEPNDYLYFPPAGAREVYVLGEVHYPGPMVIASNTSTLRAIAGRGGFTDRAWRRRILIVRGSLNHPETFVVDAADILSAKAVDIKLEPHDIVYVSARPWAKAEDLLDAAATAFVQSAVVTYTGIHVVPIVQ